MSERSYLVMVMMPPLLAIGLFAFGTTKGMNASSRASAELLQLSAGVPSMAERRMQHLTRLNANADFHLRLQELSNCASELNERLGAFAGEDSSEFKYLFGPDEVWDSGPIVKDIAGQAEPVLSAVERMLEDADSLADFETNSFTPLLIAQVRAAVHKGDRPQALRALERMKTFALAATSQGYPNAMFNEHLELINETLMIGFWQAPQDLVALRSQVAQPLDYETRWKQLIEQQRILIRDSFQRSRTDSAIDRMHQYGTPFGIPGEAEWDEVSRTIDQKNAVGNVGSPKHVGEIARLDKVRGSLQGLTITGIPFADSRIYDTGVYGHRHGQWVLAGYEFNRRMTLTAIGVKQYQVQLGRWPIEVSDLNRIGLTPEDWSYEPNQPFRLSVNNRADFATVWVDRQFRFLVLPETLPQDLPKYHHDLEPVEIFLR